MRPLSVDDPRRVGRYRIQARLCDGNMGRVFFGLSPEAEPVAVKVFRPELGRDVEFKRRFAADVTAARLASSKSAVDVVGADPESQPPWVATRFVTGPSLLDVARVSGSTPPQHMWQLAAGMADALDAIHSVGLIHGNLKPATVILSERGLRIINLGIAEVPNLLRAVPTSNATGASRFVAPEQIKGGLTAASDVYALGATLYFAFTARPVCDAASMTALRRGDADEEPSPALLRDPDLRALIGDCVAKDAEKRPTPADILGRCRTHLPPSWSNTLPAWPMAGMPAVPLPGQRSPLAPPSGAQLNAVPAPDEPGTEAPQALRTPPIDLRRLATDVGRAHTDVRTAPTEPSSTDVAAADNHQGTTVPAPLTAASAPGRDPVADAPLGPPSPGINGSAADGRTRAVDPYAAPVDPQPSGVIVPALPFASGSAPTTSTVAGFPARRWLLVGAAAAAVVGVFGTVRSLRAPAPPQVTPATGVTVRSGTGWTSPSAPARTLGATSRGGPETSSGALAPAQGADSAVVSSGGPGAAQPSVPGEAQPMGEAPASVPAPASIGRVTERRLNRHSDAINAIAFSANGRWAATASSDARLKLWNVARANWLVDLHGHSGRVHGVSFSPNGRNLVSSGTDLTVKVWDLTASGPILSPIRTMTGHTGYVLGATYAPNGSWIATASADRTVRIWDAYTGRQIRVLSGHADVVHWVAISPNGRLLAAAVGGDRAGVVGNHAVWMWNPSTGERLGILGGFNRYVVCADISPDGRWIAAASWDGTAGVFDASDFTLRQTLRGGDAVLSIAFTLDSRLVVTGNYDGTVRLWDVATGDQVSQLSQYGKQVWGVAASPTSDLVAAGTGDGIGHLIGW